MTAISPKRTLLSNSVCAFISRGSQSFTSFAILAVIAQFRGAESVGQYVLAFNYYFIFMTITAQGFRTLFVREIASQPEQASKYLVNGSLLQFFSSAVGYTLLVLIVVILPYKPDTTIVCCVMGLMMFPFSLWNITEAIFLAQSKMHFQLASTAPIYFARVFLVIWVLQNGGNLIEVSAVLVASECLVLLMQWLIAVRLVKPKFQINWQFLTHMLRNARTLLVVEGLAVLSARIQVVILSLLASEAVVGLYGAILQILLPFHIFSYSLMSVVLPILSKQMEDRREQQQKTIEKTLIVLLCVSLPATVGLFFQGSNLLAMLYRNSSFTEPTTNIALVIVSLNFIVLTFQQPLSLLLVANNLERFNLREIKASIFVSSILAVALIPKYQLVGAAVATTISGAFGAAQYVYYAWRYACAFNFWRVTFYPTLLAAAIVIVFYGLQASQQNLATTLLVATTAYGILCSLLLAHVFGGISKALNFRRLS